MKKIYIFISYFQLYIRQTISLLIKYGVILVFFMLLTIICQSECPALLVLTERMAPSLTRGGVMIVTGYDQSPQVGDIVVYRVKGGEILFVHRVLEVVEKIPRAANKEIQNYILTKGDNSFGDDRIVYYNHKLLKNYLYDNEILGKVRMFIPYLGYSTIFLKENPIFIYTIIGLLFLLISLRICFT